MPSKMYKDTNSGRHDVQVNGKSNIIATSRWKTEKLSVSQDVQESNACGDAIRHVKLQQPPR